MRPTWLRHVRASDLYDVKSFTGVDESCGVSLSICCSSVFFTDALVQIQRA